MLVTDCSLVDKIHTTPTKAVIISTGGGTGIFPTLLHRGGGSNTLISGLIPYGVAESIELMGGSPDKLVSEDAARIMAMAAYQKALRRREGEEPVIGVATSSILQRTPTEREGRVHYIYAALQTSTKTVSLSLTIENPSKLTKTTFSEIIRVTEEKYNIQMLLNLIAEGCNMQERIQIGYGVDELIVREASRLHERAEIKVWDKDKQAWMETVVTCQALSDLVDGRLSHLAFDCHNNGSITLNPYANKSSGLMMPGSFRPVHEGHWEMAGVAVDTTHKDMEFEISIKNVDKPNLDLISLERRLKGFTGRGGGHGPVRVWVTNATTFAEKAKLFPGVIFAVGYDTAKRITEPKYGDLDMVAKTFQDNETTFLVFGRKDPVTGEFRCSFENFPLFFTDRATLITQKMFHRDISSTELRTKK